jgi:hypothetical protein
MRANLLYSAAASFGLLLLGCETGGVGDPCTPEDEYVSTFSGYQDTEVNVESRSFQCETRVCLVNHFRGRVSCPYGQTQDQIPGYDTRTDCTANPCAPGQNCTDNKQGDPILKTCKEIGVEPSSGTRCRIPGTSGATEADAITVPVPAQYFRRSAKASPARTGPGPVEDSVYCSCRCANAQGSTDDGARYCECPSGFKCSRLIDNLGLGSSQLAGSYCIREGTDWGLDDRGESCATNIKNCGNDGKNP